MSDLTPLRDAVDTLARRSSLPAFGELERRATGRRRRRVATAAFAVAAIVATSAVAAVDRHDDEQGVPPVDIPTSAPAPNGWVAVAARSGNGDIYLTRPGANARRLQVTGSDDADDACPAWSPDGTRLLFGRLTGGQDGGSATAELVIVAIDQSGTVGPAKEIVLDGFAVPDPDAEAHDPHPCGVWAPDGRWIALAGTDQVWVVDTMSSEIRQLPDLRPNDLEWRPGTDELAIAGDRGTSRGATPIATAVTLYSVSTGELRRLGAVEAGEITWSRDGTALAYTGGERSPEPRQLRVVQSDGTGDRRLTFMGAAMHGIGPVWSPAGDRIAYQRCEKGPTADCSGERHEVVLVSIVDGTETVLGPPEANGQQWYPFTVVWSPDGTSLLYAAWNEADNSLPEGLVAVPVDEPSDATVLPDVTDQIMSYHDYRWSATQMWGRQPE